MTPTRASSYRRPPADRLIRVQAPTTRAPRPALDSKSLCSCRVLQYGHRHRRKSPEVGLYASEEGFVEERFHWKCEGVAFEVCNKRGCQPFDWSSITPHKRRIDLILINRSSIFSALLPASRIWAAAGQPCLCQEPVAAVGRPKNRSALCCSYNSYLPKIYI